MLKHVVSAQVPKVWATVPSGAAALTREALDTHIFKESTAPPEMIHQLLSVSVCSSSDTNLPGCKYSLGYQEQTA